MYTIISRNQQDSKPSGWQPGQRHQVCGGVGRCRGIDREQCSRLVQAARRQRHVTGATSEKRQASGSARPDHQIVTALTWALNLPARGREW